MHYIRNMTEVVENWRYISSKKIPIKNSPWSIIGESWAARCTIFLIPELGICFDIGKKSEQHPTVVFISHAHCDHTDGLPALLLEPNSPTVILPKPSANHIKKMVNTHHQSTKYNENCTVKWKIIEASIPPDTGNSQTFLQEILKIKNINFKVELFKSTHTIPTTGYGLIEMRSKLDDKYVGLTQEQINQCKLNGENITKTIEVPHVCYLGDTTHKVFYLDSSCKVFNPELEKYGTILVECTFLYNTDDDKRQAKIKKHMHWDNLRVYIEAHPNTNFIISHFSTRYKPKEIKTFFSKISLPNVFPLVHDLEEYWFDQLINEIKSNPDGTYAKKLLCQECKITSPKTFNKPKRIVKKTNLLQIDASESEEENSSKSSYDDVQQLTDIEQLNEPDHIKILINDAVDNAVNNLEIIQKSKFIQNVLLDKNDQMDD